MQEAKKQSYTPILYIGIMLGSSYVLAQYIFYFGGRSIIDSTFQGVLQTLIIVGLYLGVSQCRRLFPHFNYWQLFLSAIVLSAVAICVKILFSALLYSVLAPDLGAEFVYNLTQKLDKLIDTMQHIPKEAYKKMIKSIVSPVGIALFEGTSLFISSVLFSSIIAFMLSIFRK